MFASLISFLFLYFFLCLHNEFPSLSLLQLGQKASDFSSFFKALALPPCVDPVQVLGWFLPRGFPVQSAPVSWFLILREEAKQPAGRGMQQETAPDRSAA